MLLAKITVMDNLDWAIAIPMIFRKLLVASKRQVNELTQLSAVSDIQSHDQLLVRFTLGDGMARASSDTVISILSCHRDY